MKKKPKQSREIRFWAKIRLAAIWSLVVSSSPALVMGQQFYFQKYASDDGLSQLVGQALFQDKDGYIWIGTQAGLNRYDGNIFEIFSVREGLANDWINAITQDSTGTLWIATNRGVSSWRDGKFKNYSASHGLPDTRVSSVAVDRAGVVWCGTRAGLSSWNGSGFRNHVTSEGAPLGKVNALLVDSRNRLWIGGVAGLTYMENDRLSEWRSEKISAREVVDFTEDPDGQLWVALHDKILVFQNRELVRELNRGNGLPPNPVNAISAGPDGVVWVGLENGLATIAEDQVSPIMGDNGFPLDDVRVILIDREGIPWFGGLGGISKFLGRSFTNYTAAEGLGSSFVITVTRDKSGTLWAGTTSGLSRFDGRSWRNFTTVDGLNANFIRCLFEDSQDRFWIGDNRGLTYFDGNSFTVEESLTRGQPVLSVVEDQRGALWVSIRDVGVFVRDDKEITQVTVEGNTFSDAMLLADGKGSIWVSGDKGLSKWDGSTWRTFTTLDCLADDQPYFLMEDQLGRIWFGYHSSHGVTVYDGSTFTTYTTADGLSNDAVYSLGVDQASNIWIGTARGVDRFDGEHFVNYGKTEGYASSESNAGGFFADHDNTLWFGTAEGLSHYDSRFDLAAGTSLTPKIHSVTWGGEEVPVDSALVLAQSAGDLSIRVSPLSYINSKHLSYRYRLLGNSKTWKPLDGYLINYTHLFAGNYTLEIQGRKYLREWSTPATLSFVLKPPFWRTWWFGAIALIGLVATAIAAFKYYTYKIQARNKWLERTIGEHTAELKMKNRRLAGALTRHKQAERAMRESEKRLRDFFESSPDAIFVEDPEGNVLDVNPAACHLHKMEREHLIGKNVLDLVPPNDCDVVVRNTVQLASGELDHLEGFSWTQDGEAIPVEVRASKISHSGKPALLLHVRDVSERKHAEEELSALNQQLLASETQLTASNQQLMASFEQLKVSEIMLRERGERIRLIIDTAHDAVITIDSSGMITAWNKQAETIFGWEPEEAIGRLLADTIIPEHLRDAHKRGLKRFMDTGHSKMLNQRMEMSALRRDGGEFPVELSIAPLKLGDTYVFSAFVRDITDRKMAEAELKEATDAAEAASHSKSDFLANMSHEIRTPLNAIIGMTELILDTTLNEEQFECLRVVQSSSESLLDLINDILDFSKIEAGQMELEEIAFDFRHVVENVTDIVRVRAEAKNIELLCYVDPSLKNWVVGDKTRLQQVLINLVGNAIKFTEDGEVSIKVESLEPMATLADSGSKIGLHFKVCDTGIGITEEQQNKIFEKFSQADSSTTRKFGGTGLGLSISTSLVEMMGGKLWLESEAGKGSTFQFTLHLPASDAENEDLAGENFKDLANFTIFVVDDNRTNRFILNRTLCAWGCQVLEAASGAEALAILDGANTTVDLVILDHQMPEMDGVQLATAIRKRNQRKMKLILLSSWGDTGQKFRQDIDIAYVMPKPLKQSKLLEVLKRVLLKQHDPSTPQIQERDKARIVQGRRSRVLLAEDNPDNQNLATRILKKANYRVDVAGTGEAVVELASKLHYALILMDIQMPDMDGFAATKEIRALEQARRSERVPIVALTAHALKGYREKCLDHDMDDFMTKPLKKQALLEMVAKWIDPRPTILFKETSENSVRELSEYLAHSDQYKLIFTKDVEQTVESFENHDISLVVMDTETTQPDGFEAASAIRALEEGEPVPIVVLTEQNAAALERVCELGETECLTKPVAKADLQEIISKFLGDVTVVSQARKDL